MYWSRQYPVMYCSYQYLSIDPKKVCQSDPKKNLKYSSHQYLSNDLKPPKPALVSSIPIDLVSSIPIDGPKKSLLRRSRQYLSIDSPKKVATPTPKKICHAHFKKGCHAHSQKFATPTLTPITLKSVFQTHNFHARTKFDGNNPKTRKNAILEYLDYQILYSSASTIRYCYASTIIYPLPG